MKLETYLDAMTKARVKFVCDHKDYGLVKHVRQYRAFRDRIIIMDERKDMEIARLAEYERLHIIRTENPIFKGWDTPEEDEAWKDL